MVCRLSDLKSKIHHDPGCTHTAQVWIIHAERKVLLTDILGPPAAICGPMSMQAAEAAEKRGYATVSEIGFPAECFVGSWPLPDEGGWGEAGKVAQAKATELGYQLDYAAMWDDEDLSEFWD